MADNATTLDEGNTLEQIRDIAKSIYARMPADASGGMESVLREFMSSIGSRLPSASGNIPSPAANDADGSSANSVTPLEQLVVTVEAIKHRLDTLAAISTNTPAGTNKPNAPAVDHLGLIAANVQAIRTRLDAQITAPASGSSASPVASTSPATKPAQKKEPEGFKDFFSGILKSIGTSWKGPQPSIPQAVPIPQFTGPLPQGTAQPPVAAHAPPQPKPGMVAGMGNLLAAGLGKMAGPPESFKDRLFGAGGKMKEAANDPSGMGSFGSALGGAGKLAGAIPMVGGPIAGIAKLGEVAFKSVDRLQEWTRNLHEANMQFAEFSGAMASVQAKQTVRDINYSQKRGSERAESAGYLAEGHSELRDALAPIGDTITDMKNFWGGFMSKNIAGIFNGIWKLVGLADKPPEGKTEGAPLYMEAGVEGANYWKDQVDPEFK